MRRKSGRCGGNLALEGSDPPSGGGSQKELRKSEGGRNLITRNAGAPGTELSQHGLRGRGRKERVAHLRGQRMFTHALALPREPRLKHPSPTCPLLVRIRFPAVSQHSPKETMARKGQRVESCVLGDLDLSGRSTAQTSVLSILGTSPSPLRPCGEQTRWQEHRRCHLNLETEVL